MAKLYIVRASAGTGKTFRLTLQYLSSLFSDSDSFRHILAVTFTNKAAEEMKSRIIKVLHQMSIGEKTDYLDPIIAETGLEEKIIRLKAAIILKKILHRYSWFSVCTIDSFFQQVIRSFTREMGIQSGFKIELDEESILNKAIDDLLDKVDEDEEIRGWILKFAESRIEESKNWNLKNEIVKLGNELFKENFKENFGTINTKLGDKNFLKEYNSELSKIIHLFEKKLTDLGGEGIELINKNGYLVNDFFQKERGPAGYLKKLSEGIITIPNSYVESTLHDPQKWVSSGSKDTVALLSFCESILHPHLVKTMDYFQQNFVRYNTAKTILANIFTLGILNDISLRIKVIIHEKAIFLISDSAEFINKIIDNNDTPFIYEKVGNFFNRYLIDEFQDTSGFQWKNFKPLISNSLSQDFDCLVVGDVKQSIYRWRNSNWEILSDGLTGDFFAGAIQPESLDTNRRSLKNLVDFNNELFSILPEVLGNQPEIRNSFFNSSEIIHKVYSDIRQNFIENALPGGFVNFYFLSDKEEDKNELIFRKLIESLKQLIDSGYKSRNIAILTRSRNEGKEIADFLLDYRQTQDVESKYKFDVISDESLFLGSSVSVRFIIAVLKYFISPDDDINNYYILIEYLNSFKEPDTNNLSLIPEYNPAGRLETFKNVLPEGFFKLSETKQNYSLFELVQEIIQLFRLNLLKGEIAYIMAFKDLVKDYILQNSPNITSFLDYWEETGKQKSIPASDSQDAIRILTIHKSKGLEFEAVIVPFCDWKLEHSGTILWCRPGEEPFNKLAVIPVSYKSSLSKTIFARDYFTEKLKIFIDNLNLLYVAFTRARSALICFSVLNESKTESVSGISQLIVKAFADNRTSENSILTGNFNFETKEFRLGEPQKPVAKKESEVQITEISELSEFDTLKRMRVAWQGIEFLNAEDIEQQPLNYGKLMHELFSRINTLKDIDGTIERMYHQGIFGLKDKESFFREVNSLFADVQVNSWFTGDWKPINERDILQKGKEIKRPDRVLVKDGNALVIDFKFGEKEVNEHKKQVREYGRLLVDMGYKNVESYLWYISKRKVVQVMEK